MEQGVAVAADRCRRQGPHQAGGRAGKAQTPPAHPADQPQAEQAQALHQRPGEGNAPGEERQKHHQRIGRIYRVGKGAGQRLGHQGPYRVEPLAKHGEFLRSGYQIGAVMAVAGPDPVREREQRVGQQHHQQPGDQALPRGVAG